METTGENSRDSNQSAEDGNENISAASEEEQRPEYSGTDTHPNSSSSEDEEGITAPPPCKRRKRMNTLARAHNKNDPRIDALIQQVSYISEYLERLPQYIDKSNQNLLNNNTVTNNSKSRDNFMEKPFSLINNLDLGHINTNHDENAIIRPANKERLKELTKLQQFDSPAWKGIRYKKVLQSFLASPGFIGLKINEELYYLNKNKDFLASTENFLAGLSNAILDQRQQLKTGLQSIVDWASTEPNNLTPNTLFEKMVSTFGTGTPSYKNFEDTMQVICGKRSECIEIRRNRILKEINNQSVRNIIENVPPSSDYLFNRETLAPVIQSLKGTIPILNSPRNIRDRRLTFNQQQGYKKCPKYSYKTAKTEKNIREGTKRNQPFRRTHAQNSNATKRR